jgi:predicted O-methyltransferase YrrM
LKLDLNTLRALAKAADGNPRAMVKIAASLSELKQHDEALALAERAHALEPNDAEIAAVVQILRPRVVPQWHFKIVRDAWRNQAYGAALRRAVKPGAKVFEVGTGTGLLAMMAARAGAASVVTCEANPQVAALAEQIIANNGFADRIRVLRKHSSEVTLEEIGGPADVLVSEIVFNNLVGEGALPVMEDVVPRLLKPGAAIIPAAGDVRVSLVEDRTLDDNLMGQVCGFDLMPFNAVFRVPHRVEDRMALTLRSTPADLFAIDFGGGPYGMARASTTLNALGGKVSGVAQWMRLKLDDGETIENAPGTEPRSVWAVEVYRFAEPKVLEPGTPVTVHGYFDAESLRLWFDPPYARPEIE